MDQSTELREYLDIPYIHSETQNPLQTFDIYIPKYVLDTPEQRQTSSLVCFIHGGAWRAEDKADHAELARSLARSTGYPVAVPNYRLTPREPTPNDFLHHPEHAKDALRFLEFIRSWSSENGGLMPRSPSRLFLIGHSCSAHMLCSIFLNMPGDSENIRPSDQLVRSTAAIIMSEGIYDIDLLLSSFPGYRGLPGGFIENTFGKKDSFEHVSAVKATLNPHSQHIHWLIIHSKGDTWVDQPQSDAMHDFLKKNSCTVSISFTELTKQHNSILSMDWEGPQYVELIRRYINESSAGAE